MNLDLSAMGAGFREAAFPANDGETVLISRAGLLWNRVLMPEEDSWKPPLSSRAGGLVLTSRRLLFLRPKMPGRDAKVWIEIPADRIVSVTATHTMHPIRLIMVPINLGLAALTRRLEVQYGDGDSLATIRFHVADPAAWVKAFEKVAESW